MPLRASRLHSQTPAIFVSIFTILSSRSTARSSLRSPSSSASFAEVPDDRFRRADELLGAFGVAAREGFEDLIGEGKELEGALVDVEALKGEHARVSNDRTTSCLRNDGLEVDYD